MTKSPIIPIISYDAASRDTRVVCDNSKRFQKLVRPNSPEKRVISMTPDRWEKISELYHSARKLDPDGRQTFLDGACVGDDELRREVESLIAAEIGMGNFIGASAMEDAAHLVTLDQPEHLTKQQIGHYLIKSLLGVGGMGEVYLAQDTRLGRRVALKLLPPASKLDERERKRLLREARSAAALNHPNIVTIYSIEEADGSFFIVMEYIEGLTLRNRIAHGELQLVQLLDAAAQIADALTAAHSVGLVHRDIKPTNVLITKDGLVKLLDFGIAKATQPLLGDTPAETESQSLTVDGAIVGTVSYMSPEQIRGEVLDPRTDIFSLGAVLYEACTGKLPFEGSNPLSTAHRITATDPVLPSAVNPDLPLELDTIIIRSMAKEKEQRFQSAMELATTLRGLRDKLANSAGLLLATQQPGRPLHAVWRERPDSSELAARVTGVSLDRKTDPDFIRIGSVVTIRRKAAVIGGVALLAILAGVGLFTYQLYSRAPVPAIAENVVAPIELRITNTGNIANARAAISPDGKYVAYAVMDSPQNSSLWVRQLASLSSTQLISAAPVEYGGTSFSNDGDYVYYTSKPKGSVIFTLYRIALLGGPSRRILEDIDSPVSFSPDGKRFVFRRNLISQRESALVVADLDGTSEQTVAVLKYPEFLGEPAWSPDGTVIACSAGHADGGPNRYVLEVNPETKLARPIEAGKWLWAGPVEWLPDSKGLLMIGNNSPAEPYRVWELSYPEGRVKRITNNTVTYSRMSLAADSQALLAVQVRPSTNLWIVPANEPHQPRKMTFGSGGYRSHLRWISGRKIVFESATAGTPDISIMDEDGGNQRQLLGDIAGRATAVAPAVTPDERYIVFAFDLTGTRHIWRMDIDGGNLVQLTNGRGEDQPHCSADSKWVVFTDIGSERSTLWKVPIDGGEAVQLTTSLTRIPSLSPDGKWIACYYTSEALAMRWKMALVSPEGGEPVKIFPQTVSAGYPPKWTPDGSALTYTEPGRSGIWLQPVHGGKARRIVDFTDDLLFGFEWSPDGKQLACVRGIWERDLVLMRNFR